MTDVLLTLDLPGVRRISSGKVREIFAVDDCLLLVATDRLSAFDVVFAEGIPGKGRVLTQLSAFWFDKARHIVPNHLQSIDLAQFPVALQNHPELRGRATLCRRAEVVPIECIVRGYLEGSAWKEYQSTGQVSGNALPAGLKRRSRLPEPLFTPSTKAEQGEHDVNITYAECVERVGQDTAERLRDASLALYNFAHDYLDQRGITLADTKFEFGHRAGELILIDEALTPDSSRFWVKGSFEAAGEPISYDKQYVRDYLETLGWNKQPPAPPLPREVIENTARRYTEIFEKITGHALAQ